MSNDEYQQQNYWNENKMNFYKIKHGNLEWKIWGTDDYMNMLTYSYKYLEQLEYKLIFGENYANNK